MRSDPKIVLTGCRNILATSVFSLLNGPLDVDVVLIGEFADPLLAAVADLITETPVGTSSTVRKGDESDLKDARICVVSSAVPWSANDTPEGYAAKNIDIVRDVGKLLNKVGFNGVLIVTTYPAELAAQAAMMSSGLRARSVIGIGSLSAQSFQNDRVLSRPLAAWCTADGCTAEFIDSCHPDCPYFEDMLRRFHRSQTTGQKQAATMASCVMRVCEAILRDERTVLPVAAMLNGEHEITGIFAAVPCLIGKHGVERVLELPLSEFEQQNLLDRARETARLFHYVAGRAAAASGSGPV
jgi:L-lactate dehydrogenase